MTADSDPGPAPDSGPRSVGGPEPHTTPARKIGQLATPETIASIGEFALIQRIRAVVEDPAGRSRAPGASSHLLLGIGDDAAIIRPEPGWDQVLTCDTLVCGRHFDPRWMGARAIGRRAMTVNLSDVAAMGGEPRHALVSLGLPGSMEVTDVEELYRGIREALEETEALIIGGNLTCSGPDWFVDITLVGRIERECALTRAGARPGDRILVTGSPGRSAAGLTVLLAVAGSGHSGRTGDDPSIERFLIENAWARSLVRAFRQPEARIAVGRRLATAADRPVTALIDISDGLLGDLAHICEQSGVRARIEATRLPHDPDLEAAASHFGRFQAAWTLGPSDDYELLLTVRPAESDRVANELRAATGLAITDIGEILPPGVLPGGHGASLATETSSPGGLPQRTAPPSVGKSPTIGLGADSGLVDVIGLTPGEHLGGGWDHFRPNP